MSVRLWKSRLSPSCPGVERLRFRSNLKHKGNSSSTCAGLHGIHRTHQRDWKLPRDTIQGYQITTSFPAFGLPREKHWNSTLTCPSTRVVLIPKSRDISGKLPSRADL